jgi:hypothetical protein
MSRVKSHCVTGLMDVVAWLLGGQEGLSTYMYDGCACAASAGSATLAEYL